MPPAAKKPAISDAAVHAKTGKVWQEWFAILDAAGCKKMDHKQIVACLADYAIGGWWRQMVTVTYEQARGLRVKHQQADGFTANVSRTFAVPLPDLFAAWHEAKTRRRWLDAALTIRKATAPKSLRITWTDGSSNVEVNLTAKGDQKSQAAVQHGKLKNAHEVTKMKQFWKEALDRLQELLEA
jgi:uncharacterized protein YndB with AHSA1/START domain